MMKISIALVVVLGLCVVLVSAKPGGRSKGKKEKHGGDPPPMSPDEEATGASKSKGSGSKGHDGPGRKPSKGSKSKDGRKPGRGGHHGRPEQPEVDPACEAIDCAKPTRDTIICGTDGETYRSECFLIRDRCRGRIATDVEVASQGRCQHPAEAGEPQGHRGPGKRTKGNGKRPDGGKTGGKHPKGGRRPSKGKWPEECWELMTTMAPTTDIDFTTAAGPEEALCTASCPAATPEIPLEAVCGNNGRTYESECVLELVACITNNLDLVVKTFGECQ